jgi:N-methylhydantoinase A
LDELAAQGYRNNIDVHRALEMRYLGQNYELELALPGSRFTEQGTEQLWTLFHDTHQARFGFSTPGEIIEIVTYAVTAVARTAKPDFDKLAKGNGKVDAKEHRDVWFAEGKQQVPIYDRAGLRAGDTITGPALVEEAASVTVLDPGHQLTLHPHGHMMIDSKD